LGYFALNAEASFSANGCTVVEPASVISPDRPGDGTEVGLDVGLDVGFDVGLDVGLDVGFDVGLDGVAVGTGVLSSEHPTITDDPSSSTTKIREIHSVFVFNSYYLLLYLPLPSSLSHTILPIFSSLLKQYNNQSLRFV
jgi:hypothetical protein